VLHGVASCDGCGATPGETSREYQDESKWHDEAIKAWNTRALLSSPSAAPAGAEAKWQDHPSQLYVHWLVDASGRLVAEVGSVALGGGGAWYAVVGRKSLALHFATKQQAMQAAALEANGLQLNDQQEGR
jgi:hypothetical protein